MDSPPASQFAGKRVHLMGIGGAGMSGLAGTLLDCGARVSGSEPSPNQQTFDLTRRGVSISRDQSGQLLSREVDLVVRSAAVTDSNPEYLAARALGIPVIKYAQLLGQIMGERLGVAVAGTHGKSTTSAMIAYALLKCDIDASFVIGAVLPQLGGGSRSGTGEVFVAEACEYDRSFHSLRPRVAVITNIEADHLDCYRDVPEIVESFREFAALVPPHGRVIGGGDDPNVLRAVSNCPAPVELVGLRPGCDWATRVTDVSTGCYRGDVVRDGTKVAELSLSVPGRHNLMNATMAVAACAACGVSPDRAAGALHHFTGIDRRMSEIGRLNGAVIVDDYAHHPTEIRVTLRALREKYNPNRLLCVFQPHQASRTRLLMDEFAGAFGDATHVYLPDIYSVRDSESDRRSVSSADLASRLGARGTPATHLPEFGLIEAEISHEARAGDLIVTMGAGNVWEIARDLADRGSTG